MPKNNAHYAILQATEMVELAKTYMDTAEAKMLHGWSFSHKEKIDPLMREKIQNALKQIEIANTAIKMAMASCDTICIQSGILVSREDRKKYDK
jgi:hypothetical protein